MIMLAQGARCFRVPRWESARSLAGQFAEPPIRFVPRVAVGGLEALNREARAHNRARLSKVFDMPSGHCLDENVADRGGFDGAGDNGAAGGVGGHLVEQLVLAAAADDVDYFDFAAEDVL